MYGSVIFHIVGVNGREAAPFLDFSGKAAQYVAVALHG